MRSRLVGAALLVAVFVAGASAAMGASPGGAVRIVTTIGGLSISVPTPDDPPPTTSASSGGSSGGSYTPPSTTPSTSGTYTTTSSSASTGSSSRHVRAHHARKHRHHKHVAKPVGWQPTGVPRPLRSEPYVPLLKDDTAFATLKAIATSPTSRSFPQAPLLFSLVIVALALLGLTLFPARALASVSTQLLVHRNDIVIGGGCLFVGLAIGLVVVVMGA